MVHIPRDPGVCALFFLNFSSSWVKIKLQTKNPLHRFPGSASESGMFAGC
jgi:hypothetical protein